MKTTDILLVIIVLWAITGLVISLSLGHEKQGERSLKCESLGYTYVDGKCLIAKEHIL